MKLPSLSIVLALMVTVSVAAQRRGIVPTDTPIYAAQGEYAGELTGDALAGSYGAQLIAMSDSELRLVLFTGGLPGAGWSRGDARSRAKGVLADRGATFATAEWNAVLAFGVLHFRSSSGAIGELKKVTRESGTLGASPPKTATVLFDGSSADGFDGGKMTADHLLAPGCESKKKLGDHRLHVEFKTPFKPFARGQGRGNSGVYLQGRYECQVLDSFGLEGKNNECGGIYSIAEPAVNACFPPETWQTYDLVFRAARFNGNKKLENARVTIHHNGILIHDDLELPKGTPGRHPESSEKAGVYLQGHGNPVVYRNVWVIDEDFDAPREIVFLAGHKSHGYGSHEHRAGCMLLAKALEESGLNLHTRVIDNGWPKDASVFANADAIVVYADGGGRHPFVRHLGEIDALMQQGIGLVTVHYGVEVPKGKPGEHFLKWNGGYFELHWSVNPHWTAEFKLMPDHPIARGVDPFVINDEWYYNMRFRDHMRGVVPILTATPPASTLSRGDGGHSGNPHVRAMAGEPMHVAWASVRPGGGRGFGFTGGHVHWNWGHDGFRTLMLNAIAWSAHAEVPEGGVLSKSLGVAELQANQDYEPGKKFDTGSIEKLLENWQK